jgi:hypothetical protein
MPEQLKIDFSASPYAGLSLTIKHHQVSAYEVSGHKDNTKTHDIKARVHRNLTEKKSFNAKQWMAENPDTYRLFKQFTLQAIDNGVTKLGAKAVAERIRWESTLRKDAQGYRMNNNAVSEMARRFMAEYPEHNGIFETRGKNNG